MKKLSKKELRDWIGFWYGAYDGEELNHSDEKQAFLQLLDLVKQSQERQMDEEWVAEKGMKLSNLSDVALNFEEAKDFIRSIVQEIQKPRITKGFVEKWLEEHWCEDWCDPSYFNVLLGWLIELLKEAGCEMEE